MKELRTGNRWSGLLGPGLAVAALAIAASSAVGQEAWTVEDCAVCHESEVAMLSRTPHELLESAGLAADAGADLSCSACHGDVTAHMEEGGGGPIFSFGGAEASLAETQACQTCHGDTHPRFFATAHSQSGLSCASCHEIHDPARFVTTMLPRETVQQPDPFDNFGPTTLLCRECHGAQFAEFELNERHRLQEGILDCASCHDPHVPQPRVALGGFKQQACVDCHTDKGGPFVFEHGSVMVEGCVACHTPHGSQNRHLLTFQATADLCYSCHAVVPGFHSRFNSETVCTNCHTSIHGSNFDPAFLK